MYLQCNNFIIIRRKLR